MIRKLREGEFIEEEDEDFEFSEESQQTKLKKP